MSHSLRAGLACVDITPALGVRLGGYPHAQRANIGIHDPAYASCMVLDDGKTRLAFVGLDLLNLSRSHCDRIREKAEELCGIPADHIMISCSHSHSTPATKEPIEVDEVKDGKGIAADERLHQYIDELHDKLPKLIQSASRTTFPCKVGFNTRHVGKEENIGGNRRDPENGPCDPTVYVLSVQDLEGTVRGMMVNYAVHPTLLHKENILVSADYPGYLRACLKEEFPHSTTVFGLGPSGDQSTRYFRTGQTFDEAKRYGYTLGKAAAEAANESQYTDAITLSAKSVAANVSLRQLPDRASAEKHAQERKEIYDKLVAENAPYIDIQNANVKNLGAENILAQVILKEQGVENVGVTENLPAKVYHFSIGSISVVALPGEIFMGIVTYLRENFGNDKLIVNTLTNGSMPGYVYAPDAAEIGGYEVDTSLMDKDAGIAMADALLQIR